MVPAQCYERTVLLNVPTGHGTGFTINRNGNQWLVTAQHLVAGVDPASIQVLWHGVPATVQLAAVPSPHPDADVAVFSLDQAVTPEDLPLQATCVGAVFSQDAYFLGYPYGLELRMGSFAQPFVKKAIFSANNEDANGLRVWYLDGINNPGFSGGPVVFCKQGTTDWQVAAVVSGYQSEQVAIIGGTGAVPTNTGIIVAYDITYAVEAIDAA